MRRRIIRSDFRSNPDKYISEAERSGPIEVLDERGAVRFVLSSPLTDDDRPRLEVTRLHPEARLPTYATDGSAGLDLYARGSARLQARGWRAVPTDIGVVIPRGWMGEVRPRSGLAARHGVTVLNAPGTIDADYRGEVRVLLVNQGTSPYDVFCGDRIAQLVLVRAPQAEVIEADELPPADWSTRTGGFGSTGR